MPTQELKDKVICAIKTLDETGHGRTSQQTRVDLGFLVSYLNKGQDNAPTRAEIEAALRLLEDEGIIENLGVVDNHGNRYRIAPKGKKSERTCPLDDTTH